MRPRGVRFFVGNPGPARPASSTDEKKGKSGSIHSAHGLAGGCWTGEEPETSPHVSVRAPKVTASRVRISSRAIL